MRMILTSALVATLLIAAPESHSDTRPSGSLERVFPTNGRIFPVHPVAEAKHVTSSGDGVSSSERCPRPAALNARSSPRLT
jgi:hypothetical protein